MQNDQPSQATDPEWIVTQTESYLEGQVDQIEAYAKNNNTQINVATLDQLKSGNVQPMLPANLDMMNVGDAGPNNEVVILTKLKPLDLDCGPAVGQCMEGTRQDIITSILDWMSDFRAPNIFWVKGHPGVGKSAISVTITEGLRKSKQLGSSFFFQRERTNTHTPNTLWRVVAYDLARKYPTIRKRVLVALTANEALVTTLNTEVLFRELIQEPLNTCDDISEQNPPIIVIDALDECGGLDGQRSEHRINLRRTLKDWSTLPRLFKLIVTSRGEADLEELFTTTDHVPLEIHAGTVASLNSLDDIKRFFEEQFRQIVNRYQSELPADWPGHQIIQELTLRSGGLFIWVKIVISFLNEGDPEEQLSRILAGTGAGGMATLYSWILKAAFPHPSKRVIDAFQAFVGTVILAKEPLPASSILELCSISPLTAKYIRTGLQSVMTSGDIPRFKHQSVVDFLIDPAQCSPVFLVDQNDRNRKFTLQCLQTMKNHLRFNIYGIESSYYRNSDILDLASRIEEHISRHLSYSCCFWTDHLTETLFEVEIYERICDFMGNQFLFWLEVLSLLRRVNRGPSMMQLLTDWLQSAGRDDQMAVDMKKFMSMFGSVISQSAPHIYLSTLPFSSQTSLVLKQYRKNYPGILGIYSGGQSDWPVIQHILTGHTSSIRCVAFSPDGKRIASCSLDATIRVWDTDTGELIAQPFKGHTRAVSSVAFSPDGKRVVSGSWDNTIRIWDTETGEIVARPFEGHTYHVSSVAFFPDGKRIISGSYDKSIRVWDAETGEVVAGPFEGHTSYVTSVAFLSDENLIVSSSWDNTIRIWDMETGNIATGPLEGHTKELKYVAFSPDGKRIVASSGDNTFRVWDIKTGEGAAWPFEGHTDWTTSVAFSPDGKHIVSGSFDGTTRVWNTETRKVVAGPFEGHTSYVTSVAVSPDGNRIVSGSEDQRVRVWDAKIGEVVLGLFEGHIASVSSVALSPDGERVISTSGDKTIRVWDMETSVVTVGPFDGHSNGVRSVAFSPDGKLIVSGSQDNTIRIWDAKTGEAVAGPFKPHTRWVNSVAFSPDGEHFVSGSSDGTIAVCNAKTGELVAGLFEDRDSTINSVAFSPDGKRVVSGAEYRSIHVWDAETGQVIARASKDMSSARSVAFLPGGKHVLFHSTDGKIRVWDTETGIVHAELFSGHTGWVTSVALSSDGKCVASGFGDKTIRVWDMETGDVTAGPFEGHTSGVTAVAFSPDGKCVVSGSHDNTIRVWDVETGEGVAGPFLGHTSSITSVAFSPDGNRIVSSSRDTVIRIWDVKDSTSDWRQFTDSAKMVDGWILGPNSELLFWVPPELQNGLILAPKHGSDWSMHPNQT